MLHKAPSLLANRKAISAMSEILQEGETLSLPEFANERNQQLAAEIAGHRESLIATERSLLDNTDTIGLLVEHLGRTKRDVEMASRKLMAQSQAFSKKEHEHQMDLRHLERLADELRDLTKQKEETLGALAKITTQTETRKHLLEGFREAQQWNSSQLQQWAALAAQRESDSLALLQYQRQDDFLIRQLNKDLERSAKNVIIAEQEGLAKATDNQAAQAELTSLQAKVRARRKERDRLEEQKTLIEQNWARRNAEIGEATSQYENLSQALEKRKAECVATDADLNEAQQHHAKVEKSIQAAQNHLDSQSGKLKSKEEEVQVAANSIQLLEVRCHELGQEMTDLATADQAVRIVVEQQAARLSNYKKEAQDLEDRALEGDEKQFTADDCLAKLEALHGNETDRLRIVRERQKAIVQLRKKQQHTLDDIQDNQTQLASDINSKRGQLKALQTVLCDLCTKELQEEETLNHIRFQLVMAERRYDDIAGMHNQDDSVELQTLVMKLEAASKNAMAKQTLVEDQLQLSCKEVELARREAQSLSQSLPRLENMISDYCTNGDAIAKALKTALKANEDALVAKDVLAVEVRKRNGLALAKAQQLADARCQLETTRLTTEESFILFQVDEEALLAAVRLARNDVQRLQKEVVMQQQRAKALAAKHETLKLKHMTAEAGASDEGVSLAERVIGAAEEAEQLGQIERQGKSDLEIAIRGLKGLEAAVTHANNANQDILQHDRDLPQRLQEELQKELQLDTALREQVAKAKEDLARLEEEKGKLLDTEQSSRARRNPWQERVAAHNAALNDLNRQKIEALPASPTTYPEQTYIVQSALQQIIYEQQEKLQRASRSVEQHASRFNEHERPTIEAQISLNLLTDLNTRILGGILCLAEEDRMQSNLLQSLTSCGFQEEDLKQCRRLGRSPSSNSRSASDRSARKSSARSSIPTQSF